VEDIAAVPVNPDLARVYVEGWQSWSPAGLFPVGAPPPPVADPDSLVIDCQDRRSAPVSGRRLHAGMTIALATASGIR